MSEEELKKELMKETISKQQWHEAYIKEKEKNKKFENTNDYLLSLNHKYYEDNVTLLRKHGKVDVLADDIHFKYIDMIENYITKDKIKEKIEEIQNEYFKILENNTLSLETQNYNAQRYEAMRNVLEELLEEEN